MTAAANATGSDLGFVESEQRLSDPARRDWSQRDLLAAAEAAQLKNTGWPLGVVLRGTPHSPRATSSGIETRIHRDRAEGGPGWEDYWEFGTDGRFYVVRIFEEEFHEADRNIFDDAPESPVWLETRIWIITELLLHSASLYRALNIPPSESYLLGISRGGLVGKELWTSSKTRLMRREKICHAPSSSWTRELTQDLVLADLDALVNDVTKSLFVLFNFAEIPVETISAIVGEFRRSRIS